MNSVTHSILLRVNFVPQAVIGHFNTASALKKLRGNWEGVCGGLLTVNKLAITRAPLEVTQVLG